MMKKMLVLLLLVAICAPMISQEVLAGGSYYYTMKVGETRNLYAYTSEVVDSNTGVWTSSDPFGVEIVSQDDKYCCIRVNKYRSDVPVIIHFEYKYTYYVGAYPYHATKAVDYYITVEKPETDDTDSFNPIEGEDTFCASYNPEEPGSYIYEAYVLESLGSDTTLEVNRAALKKVSIHSIRKYYNYNLEDEFGNSVKAYRYVFTAESKSRGEETMVLT